MPFKHRMPEILTVHLGARSYPVQLGANLRVEVKALVGSLRAAGRKVAVLTDENLRGRQGETLRDLFADAPMLVLPPGEETKSLTSLGHVLDFLAEQRIDRAYRVKHRHGHESHREINTAEENGRHRHPAQPRRIAVTGSVKGGIGGVNGQADGRGET